MLYSCVYRHVRMGVFICVCVSIFFYQGSLLLQDVCATEQPVTWPFPFGLDLFCFAILLPTLHSPFPSKWSVEWQQEDHWAPALVGGGAAHLQEPQLLRASTSSLLLELLRGTYQHVLREHEQSNLHMLRLGRAAACWFPLHGDLTALMYTYPWAPAGDAPLLWLVKSFSRLVFLLDFPITINFMLENTKKGYIHTDTHTTCTIHTNMNTWYTLSTKLSVQTY